MVSLDEKLIAELIEADMKRSEILMRIVREIKSEPAEWVSVQVAMNFSGLNRQQLFNHSNVRKDLRKRKVSERVFEYNVDDLKKIIGYQL